MFGRLHYTPDEYYAMSLKDCVLSISGFNDEQIERLNIMRHGMWASLAAMGGKKTPSPQKILPLPIDKRFEAKPMTKEEFLKIAADMQIWRANKKAQA